MAEGKTLFYVGPGPDALEVDRLVFVRDGDGVKVDDPELAKNLLAREDFQTSKPTRDKPKVEKAEEE